MLEKTIDINPYCMSLTIVLVDDFMEFADKYAPEKKKQIKGVLSRIGFIHADEDRLFVVFCNEVLPEHIVHECVHLTNRVFKWTHTKLDVRNDEPQAYLTAWFFEEVSKFISASSE